MQSVVWFVSICKKIVRKHICFYIDETKSLPRRTKNTHVIFSWHCLSEDLNTSTLNTIISSMEAGRNLLSSPPSFPSRTRVKHSLSSSASSSSSSSGNFSTSCVSFFCFYLFSCFFCYPVGGVRNYLSLSHSMKFL